MRPDLARAIIGVAKEHKIAVAAVPETDAACIELADQLVGLARRSHCAGNRGDAVMSVLNLAGSGDAPGAPESGPNGVPKVEEPEVSTELPEALEEQPDVPASKPELTPQPPEDLSHHGSFLRDVARSSKERIHELGIPEPELPEEMRGRAMPWVADITKMSDDDWRKMHWERHVMDVYASYHASEAEAEADAMERLAENRLGVRLKEIEEAAHAKKQDRSVTSMKSEARQDHEYGELSKQALQARDLARRLRQQANGYEKDVTRLSREWTARHGAREAAGEIHRGSPR